MTPAETLSEVNTIFVRVLRQNDLVLTPETSADQVDGWDSLNHAVLLSEVQKHFQIRFAVSEVLGLKNVGQLVELVQQKL